MEVKVCQSLAECSRSKIKKRVHVSVCGSVDVIMDSWVGLTLVAAFFSPFSYFLFSTNVTTAFNRFS